MAKPEAGFGKFLNLSGKAWAGPSTAVPLPLLQQMAKTSAIPISVSTLTVSINGSTTNPVPLWIGNDFVEVRESVDYTVVPGTNSVFINSSGVTAAAQVTAATVYYMYAGLNSAGSIQFYPSASAPSSVQGPYESSSKFVHPGTSRGKHWSYVGFFQCTTTVPALNQLEKVGFKYMNPTPTAMGVIAASGATTTLGVARDFSAFLPKHGVKCDGWFTSVTDITGEWRAIGSTSLCAAQCFCSASGVITPGAAAFYGIIPDSDGYIWEISSDAQTRSSTINVTVVEDVV